MATQTDSIKIRGEDIVVEVKDFDHRNLRFYVDNPRIYSIVHENDNDPSQEEIGDQLKGMEHVIDLVKQIRKHGALIHPLVVLSETNEVIEGNSRLAAYCKLFQEDPAKWKNVKCHFLPKGISKSLISSLLSHYHLKGKKDWTPFERAGFLYRRHFEENVPISELVEESGLRKSEVEQFVNTYKFMVDKNDTHAQRWSYYLVYLKPKKIQKIRDNYPTFDTVIVKMIKNGEFADARQLRDKLPLLCEGPKKNLEKFISGKTDFESAVAHVAENKDSIDGQKRLAKFKDWIAKPDHIDALVSSKGETRKKVLFEVQAIQDCIKNLRTKLEKPQS